MGLDRRLGPDDGRLGRGQRGRAVVALERGALDAELLAEPADPSDLASSTWLTYSLLKRPPARSAWVIPAATRSSRTRLPIPDAGAAPLMSERCVVAAVVPLPMRLTLAYLASLD